MRNDLRVSFLAQFSEAKRYIEKWPVWMKESTQMAGASFPPGLSGVPDKSKAIEDKANSQRSKHPA